MKAGAAVTTVWLTLRTRSICWLAIVLPPEVEPAPLVEPLPEVEVPLEAPTVGVVSIVPLEEPVVLPEVEPLVEELLGVPEASTVGVVSIVPLVEPEPEVDPLLLEEPLPEVAPLLAEVATKACHGIRTWLPLAELLPEPEVVPLPEVEVPLEAPTVGVVSIVPLEEPVLPEVEPLLEELLGVPEASTVGVVLVMPLEEPLPLVEPEPEVEPAPAPVELLLTFTTT